MLNSLIAIITSRLLWGMVGVGSLSMIVWFIGPYVAIGDYRPLESAANRQIAIVLICGIWLVMKLIAAAWRARRNGKMLTQMTEAQTPKDAGRDDPKLVERFEEATRLLRKACFNQAGSRFLLGWFRQFGRQYLYQLPWYVLIGAPGAGKTTALVNSGINFPLADRFGKTALRGIGGTRHCDWWFTESAVLLDTAGRYTLQESNPEHDAQEWKSFLDLLRKYRPRQPINGVIVTVSLSDLMNCSAEERQEQAQAQHKRLVELLESLKINFPVYVMVSKIDLLQGFLAYFGQYDKQQRSQIWGFTFARAETQKADFALLPAFEHHFMLLHQRLNAGLADTMLNEQDQQARGESYLLPQAFSRLRRVLGDYLNALFATSSFEATFMPRGVYFTSGTQDRMPFDKMMSDMNDSLHLTPSADEETGTTGSDEEDRQSHGKSYFLKKFLEDAVFRESALATNNVRLTDEPERKSTSVNLSSAEKSASGPSRFLGNLFSSRDEAESDEQPGDISSQPDQVVIKHFAPIIELAKSSGTEEKSIAFDTVLKQADGLYNYLIAVQSAANSGMAASQGDIILALQAEAGRLPQPFKNMMLSLAVGASSDSQMKEVEGLQKRLGFEVRDFCRQAIVGRYPLARDAQQEIASQDFARMFAPNSGMMDSFFRQNLEGKVDVSRASWRFNPGVDGKTLSGGGTMLRSFQQARMIRDTWFNGLSQKPAYTLTIKPVSMDADILNLTLDMDGQIFRYSHGPLVPLVVSWPGIGNTNQISLQLDLAGGKTATLVTSGDWALHRLLDKAKLTIGRASLSQTATFNLEGHRVVLEFTPNSVHNPF